MKCGKCGYDADVHERLMAAQPAMVLGSYTPVEVFKDAVEHAMGECPACSPLLRLFPPKKAKKTK